MIDKGQDHTYTLAFLAFLSQLFSLRKGSFRMEGWKVRRAGEVWGIYSDMLIHSRNTRCFLCAQAPGIKRQLPSGKVVYGRRKERPGETHTLEKP